MSMRPYKRQIAKARMAALGIDRINRKMKNKRDPKDRDEEPLWHRVLTGDLAKSAEKAQIRKKVPERDCSGRAARLIRRRAGGTA